MLTSNLYKLNIGYNSFLSIYADHVGNFDIVKMALISYSNDELYFYCDDPEIVNKLKQHITLTPYTGKISSSKRFNKGAGNIDLVYNQKSLYPWDTSDLQVVLQ